MPASALIQADSHVITDQWIRILSFVTS